MRETTGDPAGHEMPARLQAMSRGRKIIAAVVVIWAIQAVPKWLTAILADGETSAVIMSYFVKPRAGP